MSSEYILCALGNPGERYQLSRHNLGFWLADLIADRAGSSWSFGAESYALARARLAGHDLVVVKPLTYMNLSGRALAEFATREELEVGKLLVVCDDTALPFGHVRLRARGSDGGHNGLGSIIDYFGHSSFGRLRLGVGPVPESEDQADFVLEPMDENEVQDARSMVRKALKFVEGWLDLGISKAMSRYNVRVRPPESD